MFDKVLNTPLLVHLEYTNVALNSDIFRLIWDILQKRLPINQT